MTMTRYIFAALLFLINFDTVHAWQFDRFNTNSDKELSDNRNQNQSNDLPLGGLLSKTETGADEFLEKYPNADGRGTVVAIFDTGVDPGVEGLQTTPDGRPKIIDLVDGTGNGNVSTIIVRKANGKTLTGLTGRTLKLGDWENPKQEYHLGMKAAYDFFPSYYRLHGLVERLKKEREKKFQKSQQSRRAQLELKIRKLTEANADKDVMLELKAQLNVLQFAINNYVDSGPIYDCVVFHDGTQWQAVIDTDEDGDLADEKILTNYRACRKYGTFASPANLNFAVNIYEEGKLLSIVVDSGRHGTHVAGIVAAHYPGQPELNGVAPGAQIVSVNIIKKHGDSGSEKARAIRAVLNNHCDLINMSVGGPTTSPNRGWLSREFADLVTDKGIIIVASAGNSGPALTTVCTPGGTTSGVIGVGAYVSLEMKRAMQTRRQRKPGLLKGGFTRHYSSRGPTVDGDMGVDIIAPDGAIAPVPQWSLQKNAMMYGTSMASPNACGNIALMLSAAKQEKVKYTPASVKRALHNTAKIISAPDRFGQGAGLLQIDSAYNSLKENEKQIGEEYAFNVHFPLRNNARGLYLREPHETNAQVTALVHIAIKFPEATLNKKKIKYDLRLRFQSKADWVSVGDFMLLRHDTYTPSWSAGQNVFRIGVHPEKLTPGIHLAEINVYEAENEKRGILFTIPITVIKSHSTQPIHAEKIEIESGKLIRRFFVPPEGATWARLRIVISETSTPLVVGYNSTQLLEGTHFEALKSSAKWLLRPHRSVERSFPVVTGRTLEVCLMQTISRIGEAILEYEIEYFGATPSKDAITIAQGDGTQPVEIRSLLRIARLEPHASLKTLRRTYLPQSFSLRPLDRVRFTTVKGESIYEYGLHYSLDLESNSLVSVIAPQLHDLEFESPVGPYYITIRNEKGKLVHTAGSVPDVVNLPKGKYKLFLTIHHHRPAQLERFKNLPLCLDFKLEKPVNVSVFNSPEAAASGKSGLAIKNLKMGQSYRLYVGEPSAVSLPKMVQAGDQLIGTISYMNEALDYKKQKSTRPGGFPLRYLITTGTSSSKLAASASPLEKEKTTAVNIDQKIQDFTVQQLKSLTKESDLNEFNKLFEKAVNLYPKDRRILVVKLHRLDDKNRKTRLQAVINAADSIIIQIDQNQLATYFGMRHTQESDAAKKKQEKMQAQKVDLIDALYRKGRAIAYREHPDVIKQNPIKDQKIQDKQFDDAYSALSRWVDLNSKEYFLLAVRKERRRGNYAQALKILNTHLNTGQPDILHLKKQRDLYELLGWGDFQKNIHTRILLEKDSNPL
jgi:tripeptidyl-peptidase II